jgi:hypothetical protein
LLLLVAYNPPYLLSCKGDALSLGFQMTFPSAAAFQACTDGPA